MLLNDTALAILQGMILKIMPLYLVMGLGFVYGRKRPGAAEPLSFLQIYFIVPIVALTSIASLEFQQNYLLLPVLTYLGCTAVALVALVVGQRLWRDNTPNIFSYACGCANVGYYGVPVALIVFPSTLIGLFMMTILGFTLFESTLGYYLVARGHYTAHDSLRKLARLPIVYAAAAGILLSMLGHPIPDLAKDIVRDFRGCYVVIGALMIGLGMARLTRLEIEGKLVAFILAFKFVLWPLMALGLIALDNAVTHLYSPEIHKMILLISVMPLPANTISFALQLNVQPDKASTMIFLSTLFALVYVPLVMAAWG